MAVGMRRAGSSFSSVTVTYRQPTLTAHLLNLALGGVPALTASLGRTADHPVGAVEMDEMQGPGSKGGLPEPLE